MSNTFHIYKQEFTYIRRPLHILHKHQQYYPTTSNKGSPTNQDTGVLVSFRVYVNSLSSSRGCYSNSKFPITQTYGCNRSYNQARISIQGFLFPVQYFSRCFCFLYVGRWGFGPVGGALITILTITFISSTTTRPVPPRTGRHTTRLIKRVALSRGVSCVNNCGRFCVETIPHLNVPRVQVTSNPRNIHGGAHDAVFPYNITTTTA